MSVAFVFQDAGGRQAWILLRTLIFWISIENTERTYQGPTVYEKNAMFISKGCVNISRLFRLGVRDTPVGMHVNLF